MSPIVKPHPLAPPTNPVVDSFFLLCLCSNSPRLAQTEKCTIETESGNASLGNKNE